MGGDDLSRAVSAFPTQTLPFDLLGPGGGGVCPGLAAKGRRNRLVRFINSRATRGRASGRHLLFPRSGLIVDRQKSLTLVAALSTLALLCACAPPGNMSVGNPAASRGAGLSCFPMTLAASGRSSSASAGNCDTICATQDSACVTASWKDRGVLLPLPSCETPSSSGALVCRCCHVSP